MELGVPIAGFLGYDMVDMVVTNNTRQYCWSTPYVLSVTGSEIVARISRALCCFWSDTGGSGFGMTSEVSDAPSTVAGSSGVADAVAVYV